jgi:hypothetical protein
MLGKKILAGIFAGLTLIKLTFLLTSPETWLAATQAFLGHYILMIAIYLVLLVITGYFVFTSLDLIDVAVAILFTSLISGPHPHALFRGDAESGPRNRGHWPWQGLAGADNLGSHRGGRAVSGVCRQKGTVDR